MVNIVATSVLKEETLDECLKLYEELVTETRKEQGCLNYGLFREEKAAANVVTIIELWENEDCFQAHLKSAHFARLSPQISARRYKVTVAKNLQVF